MKKCVIMLLVLLLCASAGHAAQWEDGLGPEQPYPGVPPVDLSQSMGNVIMYPWRGLEAERFCDVLEIYLPREDVALGEGKLTLYGESGQWSVDFSDPGAVRLRALAESELEGLMWGGGVCIEVHLPVSLNFGEQYYVGMDEGCFTASGGEVVSRAIIAKDAWTPEVIGDYGVGGLYYGPSANRAGAPASGEAITFNLVLGGNAAVAVIYNEDDSVAFEQTELYESGPVVGTALSDTPEWGVVFLNEAGEVLDVVKLR